MMRLRQHLSCTMMLLDRSLKNQSKDSMVQFLHMVKHLLVSILTSIAIVFSKFISYFDGYDNSDAFVFAGKTHTMLGDRKNVGVIRLAARQIFSDIEKTARTFIVK